MRRALVLALLTSLGTTAAHAQAPDAAPPSPEAAQATDAFAAGQKAYQAKDYITAAGHFEDAYKLDPNPLYLFNAAQVYRLANACQKAIDLYQDFLAKVKEQKLEVSGIDQVNGYIVGLRACVINQQK